MLMGWLSVIPVVLLLKNVAVSALVVPDVEPGKVFDPVLQLFSPPVATQLPFVGVVFQVAEVVTIDGARSV